MKKLKIIIPLVLLIALTSCNHANYKYAIKHINGSIDTLIINDNNPRMSNGNYNELVSECGCETYATNVSSFTALGFIPATKEEVAERKEHTRTVLVIIGGVLLFIAILVFLFRRPQYNSYTQVKNKSSTMKTIMKTIIYAGGIVIVFKVVLLLIKYLPPIIENYLK